MIKRTYFVLDFSVCFFVVVSGFSGTEVVSFSPEGSECLLQCFLTVNVSEDSVCLAMGDRNFLFPIVTWYWDSSWAVRIFVALIKNFGNFLASSFILKQDQACHH